jgi:hypothetical protein
VSKPSASTLRALSRHSNLEMDGPTLTPKRNGFTSSLRDTAGLLQVDTWFASRVIAGAVKQSPPIMEFASLRSQ